MNTHHNNTHHPSLTPIHKSAHHPASTGARIPAMTEGLTISLRVAMSYSAAMRE